jgi:hypothetical protein
LDHLFSEQLTNGFFALNLKFMIYLFIYLFIFLAGGGQTVHWNRELEMPSLRNTRVQMATGHDIFVMKEREYLHPL